MRPAIKRNICPLISDGPLPVSSAPCRNPVFYVELPNTVEGMIRLESLPQTEIVYDGAASLTDHKGHPLYTIGEAIEVVVASCDISVGHIAFCTGIKLKKDLTEREKVLY